MATLTLENLTVQYFYGAKAVTDLSLCCKDGERVAFLTAEEGGKTTVLKCIAGLVDVANGRVLVDDKDITKLKTKDRDVCLILDDGGVLPWHSLYFHLSYPLRLRKVSRLERKRRIDEVAKELNISPLMRDLGRMLYPNDIIRMCFARAKLRNAPVVLIDDIFAIAEKGDRRAMLREMLTHIAQLKGVVLFATTEKEEAFSVADRIVVMNYGLTEQIGTKEELMNAPATLFVEKLMEPLRSRTECDVLSDGGGNMYIMLHGKKIFVNDLPEIYGGKKIWATAELTEGGGEKAKIVSRLCENGLTYALTDTGFYVRLISGSANGEVSFAPHNVRLYDYASEKSMNICIDYQ